MNAWSKILSHALPSEVEKQRFHLPFRHTVLSIQLGPDELLGGAAEGALDDLFCQSLESLLRIVVEGLILRCELLYSVPVLYHLRFPADDGFLKSSTSRPNAWARNVDTTNDFEQWNLLAVNSTFSRIDFVTQEETFFRGRAPFRDF